MKIRKIFILVVLISSAIGNIHSQDRKFSFFASYNYGIGNLTSPVSSTLGYPEKDEINKLRSGTHNQLEAGVYLHAFGLGLIHNSYGTDATTAYQNADVNRDAIFENGILKDRLTLNFNGIELLYKIPVFKSGLNVTWKLGLGIQAYTIDKDYNLLGTHPSHSSRTLTGSIVTNLAGVELNYQLLKFVSIGVETSYIPGSYSKLKDAESPTYIYTDNVTRLSTGMKIKITI